MPRTRASKRKAQDDLEDAPQPDKRNEAGLYLWDLRVTVPAVTMEEALIYQPAWQRICAKVGEKWIYQLEKGAGGGTSEGKYHYQTFLNSQDRQKPGGMWERLAGLIMAEFPGTWSIKEPVVNQEVAEIGVNVLHRNNPHVGPASNNGKAALKAYAMKQDETFVAGPWMDRENAESKANEYKGDDLITNDQFTTWQKDLVEYVEKYKGKGQGKVLWFKDDVGGKGKTEFVKWAEWNWQFPWLDRGAARDLAYLVASRPACGVYLLNLSRSKPGDVYPEDLYAVLEGLADGRLNSTKYKPQTIRMKKPVVIVFANEWPQCANLSLDRWCLIDMKDYPVLRVHKESDEIKLPGVLSRADFDRLRGAQDGEAQPAAANAAPLAGAGPVAGAVAVAGGSPRAADGNSGFGLSDDELDRIGQEALDAYERKAAERPGNVSPRASPASRAPRPGRTVPLLQRRVAVGSRMGRHLLRVPRSDGGGSSGTIDLTNDAT